MSEIWIAAGVGAVATVAGSAISSNAASKAQQGANNANARAADAANAQNWNQYLLSRGVSTGALPGVNAGSVNTVLPLGFTLNGQPAEQAIFNRIMSVGASADSQVAGAESNWASTQPPDVVEWWRARQADYGTKTVSETMKRWAAEHPEDPITAQADFDLISAYDTAIASTPSGIPTQYQDALNYGSRTLDQLYGGEFLSQQQAAQGGINSARDTLAATVQARINEQRTKFGELNTGQLSDLDRIMATRTAGSQGIYDASLLQADTYSNAVQQATADELQRQRAARILSGFVGEGSGDQLLRARTLATGYQAAGNARAQAGVDQAGRLYNIGDSDATSRFGVNSEYLKALAGLLNADGAAANAQAGVQNASDNAAVISNDITTRLANLNSGGALAGQRLQLDSMATANKYADVNNLLATLGFFKSNQPATPGFVTPNSAPAITGGQTFGAGVSAVGTGLTQYYQNQQLMNALRGMGGGNINGIPAANTYSTPSGAGWFNT